MGPSPASNLGQVCPLLVSVVPACNLHIAKTFHGVRTDWLQPWNALDDVHCKTEAVNLVYDRQFHRCIDVAFFLVATHMHVVVIFTPISQSMDEPWIPVEIEDDRLVDGEEGIEVLIGQAMRVLRTGLQFKEIDDIDIADLDVRELIPQ